ncbi:MAG: type II toxin-antitoxin system VapC family toxin [Saprospiraceae bacterium]
MKYLLDTHVLIWSQTKTDELSKKISDILQDIDNEIYFSVVSLWEIKIKDSIGKLDCSMEKLKRIFDQAISQDFQILDLTHPLVIGYNLPPTPLHKDPFDRMIIWQAIHLGLTLISKDRKFKIYEEITSLQLTW